MKLHPPGNVIHFGLYGIAIGLLLGLGIAVLADYFDRHIPRTREDHAAHQSEFSRMRWYVFPFSIAFLFLAVIIQKAIGVNSTLIGMASTLIGAAVGLYFFRVSSVK